MGVEGSGPRYTLQRHTQGTSNEASLPVARDVSILVYPAISDSWRPSLQHLIILARGGGLGSEECFSILKRQSLPRRWFELHLEG